jgi:hypothetical protein
MEETAPTYRRGDWTWLRCDDGTDSHVRWIDVITSPRHDHDGRSGASTTATLLMSSSILLSRRDRWSGGSQADWARTNLVLARSTIVKPRPHGSGRAFGSRAKSVSAFMTPVNQPGRRMESEVAGEKQ